MSFELYQGGQQTGIIIDADSEDDAWTKVKEGGIRNKGKSLELVEI